ncbi:helix-turn-helix domain-containing protein [Actinokineospora guangxiensis]|uniref:Helix-turn-helix domain-containing protein n=1 Tax=Actinokineospora guangxiensis TaxID=1490288 RepID=A0ABW0ERP4_9PSEU
MADTNPTVPKRRLGRALHELREAAGMSRDDVAALLKCSDVKIIRIEKGQNSVQPLEFDALVKAFKVTGKQRAELEQLSKDARKRRPRTTYGKVVPDWFKRYRDLEEIASELRSYDTELITGLLQTEDYARALIVANPLATASEVEQLVEARIARQKQVLGGDDPITLWAIMAEGVIHNQVGGRSVLRNQLAHMLSLTEQPNITVQVAPFSAGAHAATGFGFILLRFPDSVGVDVVYQEDLTSASYLDRANDPNRRHCVQVWERVVAAALSPKASTDLIHTVMREL